MSSTWLPNPDYINRRNTQYRNPSHILREEESNVSRCISLSWMKPSTALTLTSNIFHLWKIKDFTMSLTEILLLFEVNLKRPFNSHKCNATLREKHKSIIRMMTEIHFKHFLKFLHTRMVLWRLELTLLNISLPTMVAMVGNTRAPHKILVADTWSASGLDSAGILGTGQPIPAHNTTDL